MNEEVPWWKKPGVWIAGIVAILIAVVFGEKRRADKAEGEVEAGKAREKDAGLAERERSLSESERAAEAELERLKREEPKADPMNPDEVKKYWDNK